MGGWDLEVGAGERGRMFRANLPRPGRIHAAGGHSEREERGSTNEPGPEGYEGPDCPGTFAGASLRFPYVDPHGAPSLAQPEPAVI